jgi:hypothetical protein
LRSLPDVDVVFESMPRGLWGYYDVEHNRIHLDRHLSQCERRSTLAHEMVHLERGDSAGLSPWHDRKQERAVDIEAARRLIRIAPLADALAWAADEWEVADVLWVDVATVRTRIRHLTLAERAYIDERAEGVDWGAA